MDCPCYREICSAAQRIPIAVVSIISDYAHTFSDSEFIELDNGGDVISYGDDDTIYYKINGVETTYTEPRSWANIAFGMWDGKLNVYIMYSLSHCHQFSHEIHDIENIWVFLHNNFTQSEKKCRKRRKAIWKKLRPNKPMPHVFSKMCDSMINIVDEWLYSKPRKLVCPLMPQPAA